MMWTLQHARADGTFVIERDGYPYHVTQEDPLFPAVSAAAQGAVLPPEPAPVVPPPLMPTLTRRQLRLWLLAAGKEDADVRAAIATIPDERARKAAIIEWEDSTVFQRVHPLIEPIATMLGLDTPDVIDAAWREASQI